MMEKGKTIIITGSSRGLGAAIAKESSKRKYYYFGISRWADIDLTNYELVENYFKGLNESHDYFYEFPTALVNNAGICLSGNILELKIEDIVKQYEVNIFGLMNCCKQYAKLCIEKGIEGKIINIASTAGTGPRPGRSAYSSSKAAVINFSLSLSEELRQYGIKIYTICPGAFDTQLRRNLNLDDNFTTMLKPGEIAKFVMDLVENGDFLDNQIIYVRR